MAHPYPIPADFADHATETNAALVERYGVSPMTLAKWRRTVGIAASRARPSRVRPMPEDFAEKVLVMHDRALAKHYGAAHETVAKWRRSLGVPPFKPTPPPNRGKLNKGSFRVIPTPADFAEVASRLGIDAMIRHYGRNRKVIKRWLAETGIAPVSGRRVAVKKAPVRGVMRVSGTGHSFTSARSDGSLAGRAAEFMRTQRWAVYRCNERGGADPKGKFWRAGNVVLTEPELVARAKAKGWRPDAWRELAA